jgi:hypothetical protein
MLSASSFCFVFFFLKNDLLFRFLQKKGEELLYFVGAEIKLRKWKAKRKQNICNICDLLLELYLLIISPHFFFPSAV